MQGGGTAMVMCPSGSDICVDSVLLGLLGGTWLAVQQHGSATAGNCRNVYIKDFSVRPLQPPRHSNWDCFALSMAAISRIRSPLTATTDSTLPSARTKTFIFTSPVILAALAMPG